MKVIVLGSGGWIPTRDRHTACYLIDTGNSLILLDTGTGISRLSDYQELLKNYNELNIIYSHYHLDHLMGVVYLSNWAKEKKINFYGPGVELGFDSCRDVLSGILKPPYFVNLDSIYNKFEIRDYDLNGFVIDDLEIGINKQVHRGGSFGITLGNKLHYATDTIECDENFHKAEAVKLLLHDCWSAESAGDNDHSSFSGIINKLSKLNIEQTGLIHINPNWDETTLNELKNRIDSKNILIVEDKMVFDL